MSPLPWLSLALICACAAKPAPRAPTTPGADGATEAPAAGPAAGEPSADAPAPAVSTAPGTIAREDIAAVTSRGPAWLLRQLGPEPYRIHGRFTGWEITALFPDAPELCAQGCDLRLGDVIVSVEGDALETPTAYAAMFQRAAELEQLAVVRLRDGVRETVTYRISAAPLPAAPASR